MRWQPQHRAQVVLEKPDYEAGALQEPATGSDLAPGFDPGQYSWAEAAQTPLLSCTLNLDSFLKA